MSWPTAELQELALQQKGSIVSGPFGSNIGSRFFVEQGIPVIRGNNLTKGRCKFVDDGFVYLTDSKAAEFPNCVAIADDIVFTAAGSIGQVGLIPTESRFEKYIISNKQLRVRLNTEKADPLFVYYWLSSKQMVRYLENMNNGGAVPLLNLGIIRKVPIPNPKVETQKRIASILSAYDDLIENNRRRIQLLEQAARLLYKEWFVHLRFPGHEHVQIKDGIPEGWEKGGVSDFYDTASGGTPSRKNQEFYGGEIKWVKTQELQDGFLFDTEEHITEDAVKKSSAKLFPANTVLIAMYGATIGQIGVLVDPSTCNQACCAVMPKAEGTSYEHAFLFFMSNKEGLRNLGQGAAQKNISQQVIRGYEMILPDKLILEMFRNYAEAFLGQIRTLQAMNRQLTKARDLLLPKLMNGEMAV